MVAPDQSTDQWRSASPRGPVFVDTSGQRLRRVKLFGLGTLGLVAGYVVLLLVAFTGGSDVAAPLLPLPAPPAARDLQSFPEAPAPVAPASTAAGLQAGERPPADPPAQAAVQAPVTDALAPAGPASAFPPARPVPTGARQPAALGAAPVPSSTPTPPAPGMSGTSPGQARRSSPPPHP